MANGDHPNHVAIEIQTMLENAQPLFTIECCIYRVPHEIRKLNKDAYTPKLVSVGPLHHGDEELLPMEGQKQVYCHKFIKRSKKSLQKLVGCVQEMEPKVRRCYSDEIKLNKENLAKVIFMDCGFVIELFLRCYFREWTRDDVIFLKSWLTSCIARDLLLLENQVPFFILEKLYNVAFPHWLNGDHPSFLTLTLDYFEEYIGKNLPSTLSIAHFADLLRASDLQPLKKRHPRLVDESFHLDSVTKLKEGGVKFRVNKRTKCILDLQFSGSYLEIPHIEVMDETEMLLRNMMALEQCHYPNESYITDYVAFMNFLINNDKDVNVLVKQEIIANWLGDSNEVAELFNGLGKNILVVNFNSDYVRIGRMLNDYCKHPLNPWMATLKREYCSTPWKIAASVGGIALLIFTIIQTIFTVI